MKLNKTFLRNFESKWTNEYPFFFSTKHNKKPPKTYNHWQSSPDVSINTNLTLTTVHSNKCL